MYFHFFVLWPATHMERDLLGQAADNCENSSPGAGKRSHQVASVWVGQRKKCLVLKTAHFFCWDTLWWLCNPCGWERSSSHWTDASLHRCHVRSCWHWNHRWELKSSVIQKTEAVCINSGIQDPTNQTWGDFEQLHHNDYYMGGATKCCMANTELLPLGQSSSQNAKSPGTFARVQTLQNFFSPYPEHCLSQSKAFHDLLRLVPLCYAGDTVMRRSEGWLHLSLLFVCASFSWRRETHTHYLSK